jgi:hypothetical protein
MHRMTFAAFAVVLLAATCQAGEGGTPGPSPTETPLWRKALDVVGRCHGRLLGSRISTGMTAEEVDRILAKGGPLFRPPFVMAWGPYCERRFYPGLGLAVSFDSTDPCTGKPARPRVTRVAYYDLWD